MNGSGAHSSLNRLVCNPAPGRPEGIEAIVSSVRTHLGMDVAFVAEFGKHERLFRHVDAQGPSPIKAGDRVSLEVGYCQRVVDGRLPELIVDARALPESAALPETHSIPIGSHLSVPIRLKDGTLYGTFCCFSFEADASLTPRDLRMMRAFAQVMAEQIDKERQVSAERAEKVGVVEAALARGEPAIVYQPIYHLARGRATAVESLARFQGPPVRGPDAWFADAAAVGLGVALEGAAVKAAVAALEGLPAEVDLTINASPDLVLSGTLDALLVGVDLSRLILEITEHAAVADYDRLLQALAPLRAHGIRVAVDDAGAGYASLRHILAIAPDVLKLDISLTRGIDTDRRRRALASAMIAFAMQSHIEIVAEGVETAAELLALMELGVNKAQGYHLARPVPLPQVADWLGLRGPANAEPRAQRDPVRQSHG